MQRPVPWRWVILGVAGISIVCVCVLLFVVVALTPTNSSISTAPAGVLPTLDPDAAATLTVERSLSSTPADVAAVPTIGLAEIPTSAVVLASSATAAPEPTAAPTQPRATDAPVVPTLPAEPVELTVAGVTPLLIQPGDLPTGWTGAEVFAESPVDYDGPAPTVVLNQGLLEPDARFASGNVVLWVFGTQGDAEQAYAQRDTLVRRVIDEGVAVKQPPIGDVAMLAPGAGQVFVTNQLVFRRCNAVVHIDLGDATQEDWITTYGAALDRRLQAGVCR